MKVNKSSNSKKTFSVIFTLLVTVLTMHLFTYCSNDEDARTDVGHVLLVYLGGDNNLSGESYQKMDAIIQGWSGGIGNRLLIYHDPADAAPRLVDINHSNTGNVVTLIKEYNEENSASADVFANVIQKVKSLYPASSYGLLLFSHASGWLPPGTLTNPRSTGQRSVITDGNNEMNLIDFAQAIPERFFNYIIFEACFMSGIEVAYELKSKTGYILSSSAEILSPGFTDIYPIAINNLFGGYTGLTQFASTAFNHFESRTSWQQSATFSIIDTAKLESISSFLRKNCDWSAQSDFSDIQYFDRYTHHLFFDFGDYYSRLLPGQKQKSELGRLIADCVVWKASTHSFMDGYNGFDIRKHSGLTNYIKQGRHPFLDSEYKQLQWDKSLCIQECALKKVIR